MNRHRKNQIALGAAAAGVGAIAAYALMVRPWHLRWGATDEELTEPLPGDEVKPDAGNKVTHAITIKSPPENVWKWIVQIGQGRGGFYSYDWLENLFGLQIHNTGEIRSELQELHPGMFIRSAHPDWLGGKYREIAGWHVVRLEPNRVLVLQDEIEKGSWAFILRSLPDGRTRLIARARGDRPESTGMKLFRYGVFEPAHFIMERKMMLTIKKLAEYKTKYGRSGISVPDENVPEIPLLRENAEPS